MQKLISELIVVINKHVNAVFISCSIHHFGLAFNVEGLVAVHQNTFQVMQQNTETYGETESCIYEQARIDDDDIIAMYNPTMI